MGVTTRIFQLHKLFKSGKALSLQQMIQRLEVSKATVKRDLELLRDQFGAPLEYDRHENVYFYSPQRDSFELPGLWFNASELHALLAVEQLLESVQPGLLGPYIAPLRSRIHTLLEKSGHASDIVTTRILLQPIGHRRLASEFFTVVAGAVLSAKVLDIVYHARSKGEQSRRRIHPQRLLYYRDNWYVIAWCEQADALRTFSLDRIIHTTLSEMPLYQVEEELLQQHLGGGFGIFAGETISWAVLRFTPRMANWVADEQWHPDQVGEWGDGYYELRVPYSNSTELLMDLLKYGPDVEVVAPVALRELVRERLQRALVQY